MCRDCETFEERFANELRHVVAFDSLFVIVFEESGKTVEWRFLEAAGRRVDVPAADLPVARTTSEWVHEHQQPLVIADWDRETRFPAFKKILSALRIRSPARCR